MGSEHVELFEQFGKILNRKSNTFQIYIKYTPFTMYFGKTPSPLSRFSLSDCREFISLNGSFHLLHLKDDDWFATINKIIL